MITPSLPLNSKKQLICLQLKLKLHKNQNQLRLELPQNPPRGKCLIILRNDDLNVCLKKYNIIYDNNANAFIVIELQLPLKDPQLKNRQHQK